MVDGKKQFDKYALAPEQDCPTDLTSVKHIPSYLSCIQNHVPTNHLPHRKHQLRYAHPSLYS